MQILRVSALPGELAANTMYLVKGAGAELTVTVVGTDGVAVGSTLTSAQINGMIAAEIAELDISNGVQFAADIDARDALALTKDAMVFVADASDDATVDAGAALYFYSLANTAFTKVAEYESMDLVFPNRTIVEAFGDSGGNLTYNGVLVSQVTTGAHAW